MRNLPIRKPFSEIEIDRIQRKLEADAARDNPTEYEVRVDQLTVIERTEDPVEIDGLGGFIDFESTQIVEIRLYQGKSYKHTSYVFTFDSKPTPTQSITLAGVDEVVSKAIAAERQAVAREKMQEQIDKLTQEVKDNEEYINLLEQDLETAKANKFKIGDVSVLQLAGEVLGGVVKQNPSLLKAIPGGIGDTLAGLVVEGETEDEDEPEAESSVSISRITPQSPQREELDFLDDALSHTRTKLTGDDLLRLTELITELTDQPELISRCIEFVKSNPNTENY